MRPEQIKARLEERKTSLAAISRELSVSKVSLTNVVKGGLRQCTEQAATRSFPRSLLCTRRLPRTSDGFDLCYRTSGHQTKPRQSNTGYRTFLRLVGYHQGWWPTGQKNACN
jgi:Winged helix-turn-helix DNA-binding